MRKISFRAWIVKDKKWLDEKVVLQMPIWSLDPKSETYKISQFTGLHDKNGKEIYEGDILNVTGRYDDYEVYAQVVWAKEECGWYYIKKDGDDHEHGELYCLVDKNTEIIGNIYENPELIK